MTIPAVQTVNDEMLNKEKQKKHDSLKDMTDFSRVWEKHPVLYDDAEHNKLFTSNYGGAVAHMNKCYEDMSAALQLSVAEVKACRTKYQDAVTKAVKQYAQDLREGTSNMPTAAATKLSVFNWLLPFSCHYDATLMEGKNLDQYVERILHSEANHLDRNREDLTAVRSTLMHISTHLRNIGKPQTLVVSVPKLWSSMASVSLQTDITFLHGYSEMTAFQDKQDSCVYWSSFIVSELPFSVSCWLSHNIDPTFDWKKAGMVHFSTHVTVCVHPTEGKSPTLKRSDAMALALNRSAGVCRDARLAVDKACSHEQLYTKSFCHGYALAGFGTSVSESDEQQVSSLQSAALHLVMDDVVSVIKKCLCLESLRAKMTQVPS